jgi:hypothetical protein
MASGMEYAASPRRCASHASSKVVVKKIGMANTIRFIARDPFLSTQES